MATFLLKTEPSVYSFSDLVRDKKATWDGVSNPAALIHIRAIKPGDDLLIYHTGDERAIVGIARAAGAAYPDPGDATGKLAAVDVVPVRALPTPVTLAAIKADPAFADFALVRQGRLSVVPVTEEQWRRLLAMGGVRTR